jgi:hypothetical protein
MRLSMAIHLMAITGISTLLAAGRIFAQSSLPPLPTDGIGDQRLLPRGLAFGQLSGQDRAHPYSLLVLKDETLELTMRRTAGSIIPTIRLTTCDGVVVAEAEPSDLAGRTTTVSYLAPKDTWLRVLATQPENDTNEGSYTLLLSGSTPTLFHLMAVGPPTIMDYPVLIQTGTLVERLSEGTTSYQIPVDAGQTLHLTTDGTNPPSLMLADARANTLSESDQSGKLSYTADKLDCMF